MRENIGIFRGKRVDTGQWKEGYLIGLQDRINGKDLFFIVDEMGEYHRADPETVGEFTGLYDEDGTGIFEGDIVRTYDPDDSPAVVKYDSGETMFAVVIDNIFYGLGEHFNGKDLTIIGNIHDNPELLGDKDK